METNTERERLRALVQPVTTAVNAAMMACFMAESATVTGWASLRDGATSAAVLACARAQLLALHWVDEREVTDPDQPRYVCQAIAAVEALVARLEKEQHA